VAWWPVERLNFISPVLGIEQTEGVPTFLVSHWLTALESH